MSELLNLRNWGLSKEGTESYYILEKESGSLEDQSIFSLDEDGILRFRNHRVIPQNLEFKEWILAEPRAAFYSVHPIEET